MVIGWPDTVVGNETDHFEDPEIHITKTSRPISDYGFEGRLDSMNNLLDRSFLTLPEKLTEGRGHAYDTKNA